MKKLTPEESVPFKNALIKMRDRLRGDVETLADHALSKNLDGGMDATTMPIHMADVGTDNFEQEFSLSLMMSEGDMLAAVEEALERIHDGTYGDCEACGNRIPKVRLHAIPYAAMCVKCASEQESQRS